MGELILFLRFVAFVSNAPRTLYGSATPSEFAVKRKWTPFGKAADPLTCCLYVLPSFLRASMHSMVKPVAAAVWAIAFLAPDQKLLKKIASHAASLRDYAVSRQFSTMY
ncbi:hypothetical protein [Paraburkholderia sp. RL17-337-BIB-A]|uniref:hypothetical protein n=1 Tax=Paraburkholderia sp. RL17-337-BIB-A TaxID=3031636 RepID=UPI0038BC685D